MENILPSLIGTFCAEILTLPICTIKTVYQSNNNLTVKQTIQQIYKQNNYKGFVNASFPAVISQLLSTSSKYTFYEILKKHRNTHTNDLFNNSLNGILSGLAGSILTHPFDVWKNYKQRNETFIITNYKSFYKGYSGTVYKNIVLYGCLFPIYDFYKSKTNSVLLSSIATSTTVGIFVQPFDYYKTVKMSGVKYDLVYNFYKGYFLMLSRTIPHFMITMTVTEYLK
jgi:hypothetical protein